MGYNELQFPDNVRSGINSIWTLEDGENYTHPKALKAVADIRPGLIFQHPDSGTFYKNNTKLPVVFLYGVTSKQSQIELIGQYNTIGVFFSKTALKTVFGLRASELTDNHIDLNDLPASKDFHLTEKLLNCTSKELQIEVLVSFIHSQILKNEKYVNNSVNDALREIDSSKGRIVLKELLKKINITERSLERKFKEFVGVSPKLYSRITRFQETVKQLQTCHNSKLSSVAFNNSYADQSHFTRNFKELGGLTPSDYLSMSSEVI